MSIINKLIQKNPTPAAEDFNKLTQAELEFLLQTLKTTQIVGEQVEMFYILVTKLQNQYIELQQN